MKMALFRGTAHQTEGFLMGSIGVLCFSFTLPATRLADPLLGGIVVGLGRALVAAVLALLLLVIRREPLPARRHWLGLVVVAVGVVVGFPLFSSLALQSLPASHGAVVTGLLPATTAVMAVVRAGERPSRLFWVSCLGGVLAVLFFAISQGAGQLQPADLLLLLAVLLGGLGYAEGGRLAREMGGWRVICWALVLMAPFLVLPVVFSFHLHANPAQPAAWLGFAYVSVVSMFLGFFAWYRGLAVGGVARIGQIQLFQPVLTLLWAALLLGEHITPLTLLASVFVIACAAASQWTRRPRVAQENPSHAPSRL
ncbi:MAG: DMT family transporter [Chloroflexota bacterium]|nr:DMT family transporter [Chloroflexota bacterium]